ncbi:MAG: 50S ribosome-binding GTPase [Ignavibacteriales bacterium]|nr:50S ribosome-binding GTPase [Ignavibacteriales bacterium]MCB9218495.1 50S ribosome-binding GTPase [Ignavibacteriales bacterium]
MKKVNQNCENCPVHNISNLVKLGVDMVGYNYIVALAGNPNTGKSTIFNNLTGLRQHTGNWPGKTVSRAEGGFEYENNKYKLVDLPGTYSLLSTSTDEEVARNFILFGQPDVTLIVVDATKLERNLNLVLQILEITDRAVLSLNLIDEAERKKITINERELSKQLGIPVVPTSARSKDGMEQLLSYIHQVAVGEYVCKPYKVKGYSNKIKNSIEDLTEKIKLIYPDLPNSKWVAIRLLEGDQEIIDAIKSGEIGNISVTPNDQMKEVI